MSVFKDGLRLRLSDPTPGSDPQHVSSGSLGSEDSEEEGLEPQRGVCGDLNTWTWYRSVPVSTLYVVSTAGVTSAVLNIWNDAGSGGWGVGLVIYLHFSIRLRHMLLEVL